MVLKLIEKSKVSFDNIMLHQFSAEKLEEFLESLSDAQFQKVSSFFETMPKLKHEVKLECKNKIKEEGKKKEKVCNYTEDIVLEGLQSFFE